MKTFLTLTASLIFAAVSLEAGEPQTVKPGLYTGVLTDTFTLRDSVAKQVQIYRIRGEIQANGKMYLLIGNRNGSIIAGTIATDGTFNVCVNDRISGRRDTFTGVAILTSRTIAFTYAPTEGDPFSDENNLGHLRDTSSRCVIQRAP